MKQFFHRGLLLSAFVFGLFFRMAAQSTELVVTMNDGTAQTFAMSENDRLFFEDGTKLVIEEGITKNTVKIPLSDIRKLSCIETEGTDENAVAQVAIYPNPVHNALVLRNLQGRQSISVFATDGRLVKAFEASGDQAIDVSELPIGLYFVKTQSATLKMIKL